MFGRKIPTLVELCIQTAIDNVRYLGDVGETDIHLLKEVLPHCTVDQLMHIENSTKGRDLTPVTDKLWKRFYEKQFGSESFNKVIKQMKEKRVSFRWRRLYEAKLKDLEEVQKEQADRLKQKYKEENEKRQSRKVQLCTKIPPGSKRSFWAGSGSCSSGKGNLMKKAKMEYLNSHEVKMKRTTPVQIQRTQVISRTSTTKLGAFHGNNSPSSTFAKPLQIQRTQVISPSSTTKPGGLHGNNSSSSKFAKPLARRP